jgi:3-deoxy-D-manno-octulosonic-acid transferase
MLIYNLVIFLYGFVIRLASFKKAKAKQWVTGRNNWREVYSKKISGIGSEKNLWVHCASYGEFEQGRSLVEAIKKKYPGYKIILTFFSPSGYEAFKNWKGADAIMYLPLDRKSNAADFIQIVKPEIAIFIKYEFWVNFLFELKKQNIDTYLVSAVFKPHHPFFKWYGGIFRRSLKTFKILFLQDKNSAELLEKISIKNYEVCGDTRFDRVLEIKKNFKEIQKIKEFKADNKLIIAGSVWPKDEELVLSTFVRLKNEKIKLLIVPHEVDDKSINEAISIIEGLGLTYSLYSETINNNSNVLVLNTMGLLSKTYFYADAAYIGGGFNSGLHNSLEAAVYGVPVTFYGEEYVNYNEAVDLLESGAALNVKNTGELLNAFNLYLFDDKKRKEISEKLNVFFENHSNATGKVLKSIRFSRD